MGYGLLQSEAVTYRSGRGRSGFGRVLTLGLSREGLCLLGTGQCGVLILTADAVGLS